MKVEFNTEKDEVVIRQHCNTPQSDCHINLTAMRAGGEDYFFFTMSLPIAEAKKFHEELGNLLNEGKKNGK